MSEFPLPSSGSCLSQTPGPPTKAAYWGLVHPWLLRSERILSERIPHMHRQSKQVRESIAEQLQKHHKQRPSQTWRSQQAHTHTHGHEKLSQWKSDENGLCQRLLLTLQPIPVPCIIMYYPSGMIKQSHLSLLSVVLSSSSVTRRPAEEFMRSQAVARTSSFL